MRKQAVLIPTIFLLAACGTMLDDEAIERRLISTEVIVTSEQGDKLAINDNVAFASGQADGTVVTVYPDKTRQTITGIGSSFTESSAFVLAHLDRDARQEVMAKIYSEDGANFSLARTVVGSTDFAVEGKYSYADVPDDVALEHFSIDVDNDGFGKADYPGIKDESFDLLPMIKDALAIKASQQDNTLNIVASCCDALIANASLIIGRRS